MGRAPEHSVIVRVTHWATTAGVGLLLVSGVAILLAHPRLYWGETGVLGEPALLDLPLPLILTGQTGWGRHLHFLGAWIVVFSGAVYLVHGLRSGHLSRDILARHPHSTDGYSPRQRTAYALVTCVLFPALAWTGSAMSPAVTSAVPAVVTVLGGHQSARTLHFALACLVVGFGAGHVAAVARSGFGVLLRGMTVGDRPPAEERAR